MCEKGSPEYWKTISNEVLLKTIKDKSPIIRGASVLEIVKRKLATQDFFDALITLKDDKNSSYRIVDFIPFTLSQLAQAALLYLGYGGYSDKNDEDVKWLIEEFKNEASISQ